MVVVRDPRDGRGSVEVRGWSPNPEVPLLELGVGDEFWRSGLVVALRLVLVMLVDVMKSVTVRRVD